MRPLEALIAVVAALCALSVSALSSYMDLCNYQREENLNYNDNSTNIQMFCGRQPHGDDPLIWLGGIRTNFLYIECLKPAENYTCEDIPEFDFGHNDTIKELIFLKCPTTFVSIACLERRLGVREALQLTLERPRGGFQWLRENKERLRWWRRINYKGAGEEVKITSESLAPLSALERLNLTFLRLRLAPGALAVLPALTHLKLEDTNLSDSDLPPGVLANLPALTDLSIYKNNLENIKNDTFQNLTSLERLELSHNNITSLDGAVLAAGCPRLRELVVWENPLLELRPLEHLQSLEKLDISYSICHRHAKKKKLYDCDELKLHPRALSALPQLAHITIYWVEVRTLPADLLVGSKSLLTVNLGMNKLRELPENLFRDQHMLQDLDLSHNELQTLPQKIFSSLVGLQRLDLWHNKLKTLPDHFLEGLSVHTVDLDNNPLLCDCHLYHLAQRMREPEGNGTLPRIKVYASCYNEDWREPKLSDVALRDLACELTDQLCPPHCRCFTQGSPLHLVMDCTKQFNPLPQELSKLPLDLKLLHAPPSLSWIPSTVQKLDLSYLNMKEVPSGLNLSAIKDLDLSGNGLTRVPVEILAANVTVKLEWNRLVCDCCHAEGIRQLQLASAHVKDYEELACWRGGHVVSSVREVDVQTLCPQLALCD